jgi:arsenate reductase (glutaredoxin)
MKAYGLTKCSTCQKALDHLKSKKINVEFTDHYEVPPTAKQLKAWSKALGGWEKMINRASYTWRGLDKSKTENLTEDKAIALAIAHPALIRRPLIEHADGVVTVGFSTKTKAMF